MGFSSAFYSCISGLNTSSQAMSVIGNNLANTSTIGFKASRPIFADLLSGSINGSGGSSQIGRGVGVSQIDQIFKQGTFETTESSLDLAIEGDGFFILKEPGDETAYYSRAGAFGFDEDGFLVNSEGLRVQGKGLTIDGELAGGDPEDVQVRNAGIIPGQATTEIGLTTNLASASKILDPGDFNIADEATYNYSSSTQVFDSLGNPHLLTTYFIKVDDPANPGLSVWNSRWSAENDDGQILQGDFGNNLIFNGEGILNENAQEPPEDLVAEIPGAELIWGPDTLETPIEITFNITQFNSASDVLSQSHNGFGPGSLTGVDMDGEGKVIATYSNGETQHIAQLVLGKFINPNGLRNAGGSLFTATEEAGAPRVGIPDAELGSIFTNSLELSNVDTSIEFVRMITVQRGFQANSKIITTVDELLGELINLKR